MKTSVSRSSKKKPAKCREIKMPRKIMAVFAYIYYIYYIFEIWGKIFVKRQKFRQYFSPTKFFPIRYSNMKNVLKISIRFNWIHSKKQTK